MREIQYEIVKEIAVLSTGDSGYTKESKRNPIPLTKINVFMIQSF